MLEEINAAAQNNRAARQFSQSQLTIRHMPENNKPLSNLRESKSGVENMAKVGVNTDPQMIRKGNLIDLNA